MVRYFYAWTPLVIVVGTLVLVTIPELALIALMIVALGALVALARSIVSVPSMLSRAVSRRWQGRAAASPRAAAALWPARRGTRSVPARAMVLLVNPPSEREHVS
jgi:hypothetical protein